MTVLEDLTEDECYLLAILDDHSGLDQAEMMWVDETQDDGIFRAWPFQVPWWRCRDERQIDQCGRAVGKTLGVKMRLWSFPLRRPGHEALITAPELVHLRPVTDLIETQLIDTRLTREMLRVNKGGGSFTHQPFAVRFKNGSRIMGRLPQKTGRGVKGQHPSELEMDECFPAGTLVLTRRGLVPIEHVVVGDEVFTHRLRWRSVTHTWDRGERAAVTIRGQGHPGLVCTPDHKFWARPILTWKNERQRWGPKKLGEMGWQRAHTLSDCYWSTPTSFPPSEPWPALPKSKTGTSATIDPNTPEFAWALGLFLAEGSLGSSGGTGAPLNRIYWSVHAEEVDEVTARIAKLGLTVTVTPTQATDKCFNVLVHHLALAGWLAAHVGRGATNKQVPVDVLGKDAEYRRNVLEGLVYGDGFEDPDQRYGDGRWKLTTASRRLAVGARLLALGLGFHVSTYWNPSRPTTIRGKPVTGNGWYQVVGNVNGQGRVVDGLMLTRVRSVMQAEPQRMFDLTVDDDHSFTADGIVVSNSQDYPKPGWTELFATLKKGEGASWRSHGVTRGVQDEFYRFSQPGSGWTVHQITQMHRPTWTDAERQMEVSNYGGGKDDPDYRRNIMGFHGDATNMLFVTSRLMKCVDDDRSSEFNTDEFTHFELTAEQVDALGDGGDPRGLLPFSERHRSDYTIFWAGMDVGYTADPSEVLVFAEYHLSEQERAAMRERRKALPIEGVSRLKLVARITLKRFSAPDQMMVLIGLDQFYNLQGLGFDKTGNGLPLYQFIQKVVRGQTPWINPDLVEAAQQLAGKIKGYNFSAKEIVDLDDQVEVDELDGDPVKETAMRKLALEQATDVLREYVDHERLWLPWEQDTQQSVIKEFGGQTFSYSRSAIDQHGRPRRVFSTGKFHALDGARMFAMAHSQAGIEAIVGAKPVQESVIVIGGGGY